MDKKIKHITRMSDQFHKCTFCGNCRIVCPTFLAEKRESALCRGRIDLIGGTLDQNSPITLSDRFINDISMCLNCMSCEEICPPGVEMSDLVVAAKGDIFTKKSKDLGKALFKDRLFFIKYLTFRYILKSRRRFKGALNFYKFIYPFIYKKDGRRKLLGSYLLKLSSLTDDRKLPPPNFFDKKNLPAKKNISMIKKRVGIFLGCTGKYIYGERSTHIIDILQNSGIDVLTTDNFLCCGAPALYNGDILTAKKLAEKNREVAKRLSQIRALITICGSCGHMLKNEYKKFGVDLDIPIYDISEFIVDNKIKLKPKFPDKKVTYHHSCHLLRGMKVKDQPLEILKEGYGNHFVEMSNSDKCCGGGGTFSYSYYDTAKKITSKKCDDIEKSEADIVATGCPNCSMRIGEQRDLENRSFDIVHTLELFEADCDE